MLAVEDTDCVCGHFFDTNSAKIIAESAKVAVGRHAKALQEAANVEAIRRALQCEQDHVVLVDGRISAQAARRREEPAAHEEERSESEEDARDSGDDIAAVRPAAVIRDECWRVFAISIEFLNRFMSKGRLQVLSATDQHNIPGTQSAYDGEEQNGEGGTRFSISANMRA